MRSICGPTIPVILVGCKSDLRPPPTSPDYASFVAAARGEAAAREIGARAYKECSALRAAGVDDVFEAATRASMLMREGVPAHGARAYTYGSYAGAGEGKEGKWGCCVLC